MTYSISSGWASMAMAVRVGVVIVAVMAARGFKLQAEQLTDQGLREALGDFVAFFLSSISDCWQGALLCLSENSVSLGLSRSAAQRRPGVARRLCPKLTEFLASLSPPLSRFI